MQTPIERTFVLEAVLGEGKSRRGDSFVETQTSIGTVAFWGSGRNRMNLRTIQSTKPKFTVTCGCIQPSAGYAKRHSFWVPETPLISEPTPVRQPISSTALSRPNDLDRWSNAAILAAQFPRWLDLYDEKGPFRRPGQLEWHRKTIERRLALPSGAAAVRDEQFLRALYATLQAWGIGS